MRRVDVSVQTWLAAVPSNIWLRLNFACRRLIQIGDELETEYGHGTERAVQCA